MYLDGNCHEGEEEVEGPEEKVLWFLLSLILRFSGTILHDAELLVEGWDMEYG